MTIRCWRVAFPRDVAGVPAGRLFLSFLQYDDLVRLRGPTPGRIGGQQGEGPGYGYCRRFIFL